MKYLKSSFCDLYELFEQNISVRYISEPLASFDYDASIKSVASFMSENDYDVVGVRQNGLVIGYVEHSSLNGGAFFDHLVKFEQSNVVEETTSLIDTFKAMKDSPRLFVNVLGHVGGIVTRGDLQKVPVRMWLFGLISLIEMQLLRLIRNYHSDNSWQTLIKEKRLEAAKNILAQRKKKNQSIDLVECLQFCDKRDLAVKSPQISQALDFDGLEKLLKNMEDLRNKLAHAQDIVERFCPDFVNTVESAEKLLQKCEQISSTV
ncbi:MAG: Swt1 family HEPN domain-containing protein [Pleurocapsa sp.]